MKEHCIFYSRYVLLLQYGLPNPNTLSLFVICIWSNGQIFADYKNLKKKTNFTKTRYNLSLFFCANFLRCGIDNNILLS